MTETSDHLRIIGKDSQGLPQADRRVLQSAADEIDQIHALLAQTQVALIESKQHRTALIELVTQKARKTASPFADAKPAYVVHLGSPAPAKPNTDRQYLNSLFRRTAS